MKRGGSILLFTTLFIIILAFCNYGGTSNTYGASHAAIPLAVHLQGSLGMFIEAPQAPHPDSALLPSINRKRFSTLDRNQDLIRARFFMASFDFGLFWHHLMQLFSCMLPFLLALFYFPDCTIRQIRFIHRHDGKKRGQSVFHCHPL